MISKDADATIIGAGVAGLTCAAVLAKRGYKVLVLEKQMVPGGYCTSFYRRGYMFDAVDHFINGCGRDEILAPVFDAMDLWQRVAFIKPPISETVLLEDFKYQVPNDMAEFKQKLMDDFPSQKEGIYKLFEILEVIKEGRYEDPRFADNFMMPYSSVVARFIDDAALYNLLVGSHAYIGNIDCPTMFIAYLMGFPKYYPLGGMQSLSDALADVIAQNGGSILYKKPVARILMENNHVKGVITEDGDETLSDRVVSAIDAKTTYLDLIGRERLPRRFADAIAGMKPSLSMFLLYLGVDADMSQYGGDASLICLHDDASAREKMVQDKGITPGGDVKRLCISIPTLKQPGVEGNDGKHTIMANCFAPYSIEGGWKSQKEAVAERVLKRLELLWPGITEHIEVMEAATPETLERYTGNREGACYGFDRTVAQTRLFYKNNAPPICGLYHAGHYSGGFYSGLAGSMLSGYDAARRICDAKDDTP